MSSSKEMMKIDRIAMMGAGSWGTALALLLAQPLLIRRPLMQRSDNQSHHVGFDTASVHAWIGLGTKPASFSLEGCASPTERCATPT